jgi:hypothetical protein
MYPMNIIFFNPDELRAESVGCYGHPLAPTPRLDRLVAEGTRFDLGSPRVDGSPALSIPLAKSAGVKRRRP